jgi:hypothetical protein
MDSLCVIVWEGEGEGGLVVACSKAFFYISFNIDSSVTINGQVQLSSCIATTYRSLLFPSKRALIDKGG